MGGSASGSVLSILALAAALHGLFPPGARVVETLPLPEPAPSNRSLVLWVLQPSDSGCLDDPDQPYAQSAPAQTRGCFLSGPTRISLVDTARPALLDTVPIRGPFSREDTFEVPYRLLANPFYRVSRDGSPTILDVKDHNGDGLALEVALFDAESSSLLETTLIGYSPGRDRLIQYRFHLRARDPDGAWSCSDSAWIERLFTHAPVRPGHWVYSWEGPGATHDDYDVAYDAATESFRATILRKRAAF